jgi:actin-like ATPase involved in cell morphogenesis
LLGSQQNVPNITQHFCIGHPSGWSEKEVNKYKEIIQSCFTNDEKIELIPESRAALIHTISTNRFTVNRIQQGILVIDIGSSTTDLTFISDKYSQDYGENRYDLGGSIIEKELLKKALNYMTDARILRIIHII